MRRIGHIATCATTCALALALAGCGGAATGSSATSADAESSTATESSTSAQGEASVLVNTEGMGVISWAYENEEPEFDDDTPYQSAVVNDAYGQTIHIEARDYDEYEGWHFTKWTKDGVDFSTDNRIDVLVDGDAEYVAVFELTEE